MSDLHGPNLWGDNYGSSQSSQLNQNIPSSLPIAEDSNPLLPNYLEPKMHKSNKMGIALMITMLSVAFLSISAAIISGIMLLGDKDKLSIDSYNTQTPQEAFAYLLVAANSVIGTIIGVIIITLGIIAIVKDKGRSYAILALVSAVLAPIVGFAAFMILVS